MLAAARAAAPDLASEDDPDRADLVDHDEPEPEVEEGDGLLPSAAVLRAGTPYLLALVGLALSGAARFGYVPSGAALPSVVAGGLGAWYVAESTRREAVRVAADPDQHPDERACMLPRCPGTVRAVEEGAVVEKPACRTCGTRYDVTLSLTNPDSYLDTTAEGSDGTEEQLLDGPGDDLDPDPGPDSEQDSDGGERRMPTVSGWNE